MVSWSSITDQRCTKVSPIELMLHYRFATPKSLKTRRPLDCCVTAPLCNSGIRGVSDRIPTEGWAGGIVK